MVATATAAVLAVVLSAIALEPEDCTYWRRWLSLPHYAGYRLAIAAVPLVAAVLASTTIPNPADLRGQLLQGVTIGVTTAALLRATLSRKYVRGRSVGHLDRETSSALSWLYHRLCTRLDKAAERNIKREMARFKKRGFEHADELVALAEEVVELLNIERVDGRTKALRTRADEKYWTMFGDINVVKDPLAAPPQRRTAVLALSERLRTELVARRWDSPPAHQM